ncbi:hypothetical protein IW146_001714 [Coemansia sp. RSA 922]|nr:hypothetical protein H4S03_004146 [Coemansia sp. S3946]KAJ2116200.1 hypothetical protein IW146_001714 [Coemansia sp. RSA 922]
MDNTSLITFVEHAYWLVDQGPESSGITFEEAQHALLKLDRIAHDLYGMTKMVTDLRPCLTDLVALMANIPTFRTAANAPAPLPAVASALVAAPVTISPMIAHDPETPIASPVAPRPVASQVAATTLDPTKASDTPPLTCARESREANRDTPTRPPLAGLLAATQLIRPIAVRPCPSIPVDKKRGMGGEAQAGLPPQKRHRAGAQDDNTLSPASSEGKLNSDPRALLNLRMSPSFTGSMIRDNSNEEITCIRLSRALGQYSSIPLGLLPMVYRLFYGCELVPRGADTHDFLLRLTELEGFEYWYIPFEGADLDGSSGLEILRRDGPALETMHHDLRQLLAKEQGMTVVAPKLLHFLCTLCCMRAGLLTGPILSELFERATGQSLSSLNVVTERGIHRYTDDQLAEMLKNWLKELCAFISNEGHAQYLLDGATTCSDAYRASRRKNRTDGAGLDQRHVIAQEMLASNEHNSQLVLGISPSSLEWLYMGLQFLAEKLVDRATLRYLKSLSDGLYIDQR